MRLYNPLHFKKFVKNIIGVNYLNRRIDEAIIEKASHTRVNELEHDIFILKKAIDILRENSEHNPQLESLLEKLPDYDAGKLIANKDKKFIFVCGLHRSGTSLFTKIIQHHPDISGFENTGVLKDEGQYLQTVYLPERDLGWAGSFGFSKGAHLTEDSRLVSDYNRDKLLRQWSNYWDASKEYLVEKTPSNLIKTRFLKALFPNSYFIIIRRHPVATCMATRKWSLSSMNALLKHWICCYDLWDEDKKHLDNYVEIKYEDFIVEPVKTLQSVFKLCKLNNVPDLEKILNNYNLSSQVNEKYFDEWNKMKIEKIFANFRFKNDLKRHGY